MDAPLNLNSLRAIIDKSLFEIFVLRIKKYLFSPHSSNLKYYRIIIIYKHISHESNPLKFLSAQYNIVNCRLSVNTTDL